jgi:uncharacterized membrane protein (Fun14 family)
LLPFHFFPHQTVILQLKPGSENKDDEHAQCEYEVQQVNVEQVYDRSPPRTVLASYSISKTHLKQASHQQHGRLDMSEIVSPVVFQLGVGGVGGFVVGFALKKLSKLILVLIGIFIVALIYLATQGVINIDYAALWSALENLIGLAGSAFSWIIGVISLLPFAASFIAGFLLGLKLG